MDQGWVIDGAAGPGPPKEPHKSSATSDNFAIFFIQRTEEVVVFEIPSL